MKCSNSRFILLKNKYNSMIEFFKKINSKKCIITLSIIVFIVMVILNSLSPFIADDYSYAFGVKGIRISNIIDIFHFQVWHYFNWGGRIIAHFLAQLFIAMPPILFDIANAAMFVLFTLLIYYHIKGYGKHRASLLLFILILLWFFTPAFGETLMWTIGSCNYLWGMVLILAYLLPYRLYLERQKKFSLWKTILFTVFGIIAGWTNENTAFAMIMITSTILILERSQKMKIPVWQKTGLCSSIIGFLLLICAPGNFVRSEAFVENSNFIIKIVKRFIKYTYLAKELIVPLLLLLLALSIISYHQKNKKFAYHHLLFVYLLGSFFAIYSMLMSPTFPDRAWFGAITYTIISCGISYYALDFSSPMIKQLTYSLLVLTSGLMIFEIGILVYDDYQFLKKWNDRIHYIEKQKQNNELDIIVPSIVNTNKRGSYWWDIGIDPNLWPNTDVARYYQIRSIRIS